MIIWRTQIIMAFIIVNIILDPTGYYIPALVKQVGVSLGFTLLSRRVFKCRYNNCMCRFHHLHKCCENRSQSRFHCFLQCKWHSIHKCTYSDSICRFHHLHKIVNTMVSQVSIVLSTVSSTAFTSMDNATSVQFPPFVHMF